MAAAPKARGRGRAVDFLMGPTPSALELLLGEEGYRSQALRASSGWVLPVAVGMLASALLAGDVVPATHRGPLVVIAVVASIAMTAGGWALRDRVGSGWWYSVSAAAAALGAVAF